MRGGYRPKAGRKRLDQPRNIRRLYRFNEVEFNAIKEAVIQSGLKESEFVRNAILKEVQKVLGVHK